MVQAFSGGPHCNCWAAQVSDSMDLEEVSVPVLLPHEILDALARAGSYQAEQWAKNVIKNKRILFGCFSDSQKIEPSCQFATSMLGNGSPGALAEFWEHCLTCDEWRDHPILTNPAVNPRSDALSFKTGWEFQNACVFDIVSMATFLQRILSYPRCGSTIFPCGRSGVLSGCRIQCVAHVQHIV